MTTGYFQQQNDTKRPGVDTEDLDPHHEPTTTLDIHDETHGDLAAYFQELTREAYRCYAIAKQARQEGIDPETEPEIPFAEDLASRVEALVGPEGIAQRIRELSDQMEREELALTVSKEVAAGRFTEYEDPEDALDAAIRAGLAVLTEGILVAPLEGVAEVKVRTNEDGTQYGDVYFAGPIRAAGGTGQALSVLIADVVRRELSLGAYQATKTEVERFKEEIPAYKKAVNLQYTPTAEEIELIVANLPVGVNGEGTETEEVSGQRDLPRVETNRLRGGACLVIAEGMTLKASKLQKHVHKLGLEGWGFLDDYLNKGKDDDASDDEDGPKIKPNDKFIKELTAGRPVLSHPSATGGFRLRYGRARTAGLAATSIHPALCGLTDDFLAIGTQMKTERPGKGTLVAPCDTIEPPIVRLDDGTVQEVSTYQEALELRPRVETVLDLGEMLVPYGEFLENNKPLPPASWCPEWWERLLEAEEIDPPTVPDDAAKAAFRFAERTDTPLHPRFTYFWYDLEPSDVHALAEAMQTGSWDEDRLRLPSSQDVKEILETLGAGHRVQDDEIILDERASLPVARGAGYRVSQGGVERVVDAAGVDASEGTVGMVSRLSGVTLKVKGGCRIGARMGRPEKAAAREMSPPVHGLFPLGGAGGLQRLIKDAAKKGTIGTTNARDYNAIEVGARVCSECPEVETLALDCPECGARTRPVKGHPKAREVPLKDLVEDALGRLAEPKIEQNTKGVQGLISETKLPEPLEKGILRAKREIYVFKDGTCRYDMTDLALTQFRPGEVGTSVEKLQEMGYEEDVAGAPLEDANQLVGLKPQDVIINEDALEYMARVAGFVDDELTRLYGIEPFYDLDDARDLIGHLAVGLAPHTSGGVLCRIVGTTKAAGHWCHPYFHAAKRRNCLHPESSVHLFKDGGPERTTLEEFYEGIPGEGEPVDDVGTLAKELDGSKILSVNPDDGKAEPKRIERVYRSPAPDHLVRIQTASGRTLLATPNHRLVSLSEGRLEKRSVCDLSTGDRLLFAERTGEIDGSTDAIDLLRELDPDSVEGVMVRGLGAALEDLIEQLGGLTSAAQSIGISMKTLSNYKYRDSVPLDLLHEMLKRTGSTISDLPAHLHLAAKRDSVEIPRLIPFSPAMGRMVGYYLAEGHARSEDLCYQVHFSASEEEIVQEILECVQSVFGLSPRHDGKGITLSGRLIHHLFVELLGLGTNAHTKKIPECIASKPRPFAAQMLSAFFAGDGSVETGRLHITCHSANRGLLRDIGLQLGRWGIAYRLRTETRKAGGVILEFYEEKEDDIPEFTSHRISIRSDHALKFIDEIGFALHRKQEAIEEVRIKVRGNRFTEAPGDVLGDTIKTIEPVPSKVDWVYDLEVEDYHNYFVNDFTLSSNCDGDEDPIMLLLDGLINFSRWYLPDRRGGQMDAPLTLSLVVDPEEIDGEAHNVDCARAYPLEFFEATEEIPGPKEVRDMMEIVEDRLGTAAQYEPLGVTHDTSRLDDGPRLSAYKTIGSMKEKMEGQLSLGEKLRAVDAGDVASRVICDHFLPDIQGNLNAFSRQTVRCAKCNAKYRRVPLDGRCTKCRNNLTMTVHEASVKKYVDIAREVAQNYAVDAYTQQRLKLIDDQLESLFTNDKVEKAKLSDFL